MIYKVFRPEEWQSLQNQTVFTGSPDDARDGFIHLSYASQISGVLARYFGDCESVVIAAIPESRVAARDLKVENGFPHLYADLPSSAIAHHWTVPRGGDGRFDLPPIETPESDC